jgi:hypothetical protein
MSCMEMGACMKWRRTVGAWIGWADLLLTAGNPSINHSRLFFWMVPAGSVRVRGAGRHGRLMMMVLFFVHAIVHNFTNWASREKGRMNGRGASAD